MKQQPPVYLVLVQCYATWFHEQNSHFAFSYLLKFFLIHHKMILHHKLSKPKTRILIINDCTSLRGGGQGGNLQAEPG